MGLKEQLAQWAAEVAAVQFNTAEEVEAFRIESTWLILSGNSGELATFEAWYE